MKDRRTIPADRRAAACDELANLVALLNKGAASLSAKIALLGHHDPKMQSKGLMSLARYQTFGNLPARDAVMAIEARLRGESVEEAEARTVKRHTDAEREEIARDARRDMIEGDWSEHRLLVRFRKLPEERQHDFFMMIGEEAIAADIAAPAKPKRARKPKAAPVRAFQIIEGGR